MREEEKPWFGLGGKKKVLTEPIPRCVSEIPLAHQVVAFEDPGLVVPMNAQGHPHEHVLRGLHDLRERKEIIWAEGNITLVKTYSGTLD